MRRWHAWFFRPSVQLLFWLLVAVIGWVIVKSGPPGSHGWAVQRPDPVIMASPGTSVAPEGWTGVAKAVMPAVVNIATSKTTRGPGQAPFFTDPFFRFLPGAPEVEPRRERSLGSGVIITADGYASVAPRIPMSSGSGDCRWTRRNRGAAC